MVKRHNYLLYLLCILLFTALINFTFNLQVKAFTENEREYINGFTFVRRDYVEIRDEYKNHLSNYIEGSLDTTPILIDAYDHAVIPNILVDISRSINDLIIDINRISKVINDVIYDRFLYIKSVYIRFLINLS